mmetsp:Transcript_926/g.1182  ORF Transcript_926/g.1182 Transcript_926/m.1182 type:complete len:100 (+) Transcript_926:66-365(+)
MISASLSRAASRVTCKSSLKPLGCNLALVSTVRNTSGLGIIEEKGKGAEMDYINSQEKILLIKLRESKKIAKIELLTLLGDNELPDEVLEKLIDWKHGH